MKEKPAIYYPDGASATRTQVRRKLLFENYTTPVQHTAPQPPRSFQEWQPIVERRKQEYRELISLPEYVEIEIGTDKPVLLTPIGDVHALHPEVNLERFNKDVGLTKEAAGYFLTFGDLTDSIFWGPVPGLASDMESLAYMQAAIEYMAEDGHLLAAWLGDHDGWALDKHNAHTLYQDFFRKYNAHLLDGVSYVDIGLNDGDTVAKYAFIGSHRHKGFSVYNDAHASWRQYNDEAKTSRNIISLTAHNHTKAFLQQTRKAYGGNEALIYAVSLGTYKESDRYSRKHGWPRKGEETASAFGIVLHPGKELTQIFWTVDEAVDSLTK